MFRAAALLSLALAALGCSSQAPDPLAIEVRRWSELARTDASTDEISVEARKGAQPALAEAEEALRHGRRLLALSRLIPARIDLAAAHYVRQLMASGLVDEARLEAEWKRVGGALRPHLGRVDTAALDGVEPAAIRALAEAALPQVRKFYEASLDYGRNTMPDAGLFYLGAATAERDIALWSRELSSAASGSAPALRPLRPELDALESDLLAAYRPPASIDRHDEFIAASATLKEARELDAAGLRRGALLLYLQAALRTAAVRSSTRRASDGLDDLGERLSSGDVDHSIGRLFLEMARADLEATGPTAGATAAAVTSDVLPRYFAALEPAAPQPPQTPPRVTVTLVRWPFT